MKKESRAKVREIKIVILGDIEDTSILNLSNTQSCCNQSLIKGIPFEVNQKKCMLKLFDLTQPRNIYAPRPFYYPKTDCFVLIYEAKRHSSYNYLMQVILPELRFYRTTKPLIILGLDNKTSVILQKTEYLHLNLNQIRSTNIKKIGTLQQIILDKAIQLTISRKKKSVNCMSYCFPKSFQSMIMTLLNKN